MPATWCDWARTRRRGLRRSPHYLKQAAHVHAYDPAAAAVSIETEAPSHLDCGAPESDRWVDRVAVGGGVLVVRGAACVWQETWAGARKHGPRRQQPGRCWADRLGLERGDDGRRRRADVRALHFGGARGPANCNSALRPSDSLPGTHGNPPNTNTGSSSIIDPASFGRLSKQARALASHILLSRSPSEPESPHTAHIQVRSERATRTASQRRRRRHHAAATTAATTAAARPGAQDKRCHGRPAPLDRGRCGGGGRGGPCSSSSSSSSTSGRAAAAARRGLLAITGQANHVLAAAVPALF